MQRLLKKMEPKCASLLWMYSSQNASIWGKLITNFAGPMNNFILGVIVFDFDLFARRC